jgi:hypothetical protein
LIATVVNQGETNLDESAVKGLRTRVAAKSGFWQQLRGFQEGPPVTLSGRSIHQRLSQIAKQGHGAGGD